MKLLLLGDVCPREFSAPYFEKEDVETLFGNVAPLFKESDFAFVNLECAITESENRIPKFGPHLKAPRGTANTLKKLGVDCVGLSNNHVFDFGKEGIRDTLDALQEAGIDYTGFGENYDDSRKDYIIDNGKEKIALITVCEHEYSYALENRMGSRPYDPYDTMLDIRAAKAKNDKVIVIYHGGKEYSAYPSPRVRKLCRAMIDNGADVVLGQHSHCIATYESYNGGHILHGQGNFHFTWESTQEGWYTSLATIYDTDTKEIRFIPLRSETDRIHLAEPDDAKEIMEKFEKRNQSLIDGSWIEGWHAFCESVKDGYVKTIAETYSADLSDKKNAKFSHYLDCEAHTDVWRELYPSYNLTTEID